MKKLLLFSLLACAIASPLTLSAQKKKKGNQKPTAVKPVVLATESDSISYAFGATMVQNGLLSYLGQMGVTTDTLTVINSYTAMISKETDNPKINKLKIERDAKLDSIKKANSINIDRFLSGFSKTVKQGKENAAYNSGIAIGSQLGMMTENFSKEVLGDQGKFNSDAFVAAFTNSLKNESMLLENAEEIMQQITQKSQEKKQSQEAETLKVEYADKIAQEQAFLDENKTKDGIVTSPSGLQYKVITAGTGAKPTESDKVKVHYKGTLLDGTTFDSSIDRGEPVTFGVKQVIKGWTEALLLMPAGSKWELYIPYDLAYGARDTGTIKPFSLLIFEIELLDIEQEELFDVQAADAEE